jgi:hypothetical protein
LQLRHRARLQPGVQRGGGSRRRCSAEAANVAAGFLSGSGRTWRSSDFGSRVAAGGGSGGAAAQETRRRRSGLEAEVAEFAVHEGTHRKALVVLRGSCGGECHHRVFGGRELGLRGS